MQLSKETNNARFQITKYSAESVTVNDQEYTSSILVTPNAIINWSAKNIDNLNTADIAEILKLQPAIILLGTGSDLVFPNMALLQAIYAQKIGIETMTTPAACRTYTALTSEGRNVLAALII